MTSRYDSFSSVGAHAIADRLHEYWRQREYYGLKTRIEQDFREQRVDGRKQVVSLHYVRSNMRGGYPPKDKE